MIETWKTLKSLEALDVIEAIKDGGEDLEVFVVMLLNEINDLRQDVNHLKQDIRDLEYSPGKD